MGRPHVPTDESAPAAGTISLPTITDDDVREMTDSGSFSRGLSYQRQGMVFDAAVRGARLVARCHGSSGGPYRVQATFATADDAATVQIVDWSCDCPRGGFCKHVVALLLTWADAPEEFDVRPDLATLLAEKSREELIDLIGQLVGLAPELDRVLDRLVPVPVEIPPVEPGSGAEQTVDVAPIRRKVASAFREYNHTYDEYAEYYYDGGEETEAITEDVRQLIDLGDRYAEAGRWADAQAVYTTIAEQVMAQADADYAGDAVYDMAGACGDGLVRCLEAQEPLAESDRLSARDRAALIDAIFQIWRFLHAEPAANLTWYTGVIPGLHDPAMADAAQIMQQAGITSDVASADGFGTVPGDYAYEAPDVFARLATEPERQRLIEQLRPMTAADGTTPGMRRAALRFLLTLEHAEGITDEERLEALKGAELWGDAIAHLVGMARYADAVALAGRRLTTPVAAISFASLLRVRGEHERAIQFIDGRLWETEGKQPHDDFMYLDWLRQAYAATEQPSKAFDASLRRFKLQPGFPMYLEVREATSLPGLEPGLWEKTRADLLAQLKEQGAWGPMIEAHLQDGEVAEAIAALHRMEAPEPQRAPGPYGYGYAYGWSNADTYRQRVAEAARDEFPDEAVRLFRALADRGIQMRNRGNYQDAAGHLASVKQILEAQGRTEEWSTLIVNLRDEHKRLRALKEELNAAGL